MSDTKDPRQLGYSQMNDPYPPSKAPQPYPNQSGSQQTDGYPGVRGSTPQVPDSSLPPSYYPFAQQPCPQGGTHEIRSHYTNATLLVSFCIIPNCCGYVKKDLVCKKCNQNFGRDPAYS
ncbi:hypothetical protein K493DRAFT_77735 [Basidiobolus meristosporus CBS 931.73]|uniref:Brain protein I3 n=1 Tax=Basidiobolus meristosporus CBS 931.73 TaxID=1314790 RepID=A0A1Y1XSM5_9FUNG|nr:hypothetical protein K493DRAFT_77735 [Basidiobolus meristosporus CBS 931.73]|eukprot:ORX88506.1 hypothetical protein K493DRAFT_77735 [Basidiobolus meristosporus CBS 931.73]